MEGEGDEDADVEEGEEVADGLAEVADVMLVDIVFDAPEEVDPVVMVPEAEVEDVVVVTAEVGGGGNGVNWAVTLKFIVGEHPIYELSMVGEQVSKQEESQQAVFGG